MPIYRYNALDAKGNEKKGTIEALNNNDAIIHIRRLGLFPTKVRPAFNESQSPAENNIESKEKTFAVSDGSFLFPKGSKCKCKRGIETFSGSINIWGEDGKRSLVFKSNPNRLQQQQSISIDLDNIQSVEKRGLFRTTHIINTKAGDEYVFTGNIGRIADIVKFELDYRNRN